MLGQLILVAVLGSSALAQTVPVFGQCGGESYTGATQCAAGNNCVVFNPFFFQCVPDTETFTGSPTITNTGTVGASPTSTVKTTSTVASTTPVKSTSTVASTTTVSTPFPTGFVKTSGTRFTLNGAPFTVFGTNAYWPALQGYSNADIDQAFADMAAAGVTVVRGFNEVTNPFQGQVFFHQWAGATATVNTGTAGLQRLDQVVASAKAHGIRVIITLSDFGGMDVYAAQLIGSGQPHDVFYTNPTIIAAFKTYVQAVVSRYANEPGVMVGNEPRCAGSNTAASANCTTATITNWASTISTFIKSLDANHLVALGDEGFLNEPGTHNFDFVYQGTLGIDFAANMNIKTLDFGTFHESWGETANPDSVTWGVQWINDHAAIMKTANKPAIMEEFGLASSSGATRAAQYTTWYNAIISSGLTGDLVWQAGSDLSTGPTPNDGFAIFPSDPVYALMKQHAAALKSRG
ncbi:glycoside hydrolase superfamily [Mycena pura]|uniref:mannan endo-1,4-beta-mannosidase n=1 Tax=Mycena pura TaxID=153505 RepID=A0AAD6VGA4_9AGAR|nr:glycoside hydrolase superfamily [Mycena pura]